MPFPQSEPLGIICTVATLLQSSGGPSVVISKLCEEMSRIGVRIEIITTKSFSKTDKNLIPDSKLVTTHMAHAQHLTSTNSLVSLKYRKILTESIVRFRPHLIHDNGIWLSTNHTSSMVAWQFKIPFIASPHGMLEPWAMSFRAWKKQLAWKLYQKLDLERAALLLATSTQEAKSIRKIGLKQPIAIIPNGIDLPEWKERSIPKDRIHTALFLSRVHPKKGLINLVAAWDRVRTEGWRMIIAGPDEGNHRVEVESAVRRAGLEKDFQFVGPVEGEVKERLYRDADLFILPTYSENFGVVVAEALAYGVPVITTKGAPWDCLITHRCGWWVELGPEPLANAIREATALSDAARQEMGSRGRDYVAQHFSWPKIAEQMLAAYEWVLHKGPIPNCIHTNTN